MIVEGILNFIISILPSFSIGIDLVSVVAQISSFLAYTNYYIALEDFVAGVGFVLSVWVACSCISIVIEIL